MKQPLLLAGFRKGQRLWENGEWEIKTLMNSA